MRPKRGVLFVNVLLLAVLNCLPNEVTHNSCSSFGNYIQKSRVQLDQIKKTYPVKLIVDFCELSR